MVVIRLRMITWRSVRPAECGENARWGGMAVPPNELD